MVLANGATAAISSLTPGQKVLATDTATGTTQAKPVEAVLVNHDTNLFDLKVRAGHHTAVIHTTANHPVWDATAHRWVKAAALRHGAHLRTPSGAAATILGGHSPRERTGWMWDLTVASDHDFYVQAATTAILVHNCGPNDIDPWQVRQRVSEHVYPLHGPGTEASGSKFLEGTTEEDIVNMVHEGISRSASDVTGVHSHLADLGDVIGTVTTNAGITRETSWVKIWMNNGELGTIHPTLEMP